MGEVWRARHPSLERDVAVKVIRADLHDKPAMRELFHREVQALSRLRSPQTVQVMDAGITEAGQPYIVTEFLEGTDLHAHLKACGAMPVAEGVHVAKEVLESLAEAHAMGLIHRDIKPANVFLQQLPGGGRAVKVLDFGVAKMLGGDESEETLAGGAALKGSPRYMAPEQIRGTTLSPQTDLYAVGGLLYHMVSGETVFTASGREALLMAHLNDTPVSLLERCPYYMVPPALDAVVLQCLRKTASDRPWGARELIAALDRALGAPEGPVGELTDQGLGDLPAHDPVSEAAAPAFSFDALVGAHGTNSSGGARMLDVPAPGEAQLPDWLDETMAPNPGRAASASPSPAGARGPKAAPTPVPAPSASAAPVEEEVLELAEVPGRRRGPGGIGAGAPPAAPAQPASSTPRSTAEPELQLAQEPRTVAEGQRRHHEVQANRIRREQSSQQTSAIVRNILAAMLIVGAVFGGIMVYRSLKTPESTVVTTLASSAPKPLTPLPPRPAVDDAPAVARNRGGIPVEAGSDTVTVGVSTGTANFVRVDTGDTLCTDAVECPMPVGVSVRVQRAGGKGVTLPPLKRDQAAAGVIQVQLDR
jgi:serine/threonine-protein kinase